MVAITHPAPRTHRSRPAPTAATFRRRRLVAAALAVLVLVSVVNLALQLTAGEPAAVDAARPVAELRVVVEPGDTVWSIARSLAGDGDIRPVVDAIVEANGGAGLVAGDRLELVLP
jgi:nucleoid-associated protein YgaU